MNGNDRVGSTVSGVSVGRTASSKYVLRAARSSLVRSSYSATWMPASASAGSTASW
jgi:hypothetical protein